MTIDEAIAHAREKAKEIRENIIDGNNLEPYESYCNAMTERCAEKHEQLAEWLEELKAIKDGSIPIIHGKAELELHDKELYNKTIDDFVTKYKFCDNRSIQCRKALNCADCIAEQLKAGGNIELSEHSESQGD